MMQQQSSPDIAIPSLGVALIPIVLTICLLTIVILCTQTGWYSKRAELMVESVTQANHYAKQKPEQQFNAITRL